MKYPKFETLMKSEIKKAEAFASKANGVKTYMTGWCTEKSFAEECDLGFKTIRCEMCTADDDYRANDVMISVCLWDRRRSFVSAAW